MKKILFSLFVSVSVLGSYAQTNADKYQEAVRLYQAKAHIQALPILQELSTDVEYGPYASFYSGLIQYEQGNVAIARTIWQQLLTDFPAWNQSREVRYWLAVGAFTQGNFDEGLTHLSGFSSKESEEMQEKLIVRYLAELDIPILTVLQKYHPSIRPLAALLAFKLNLQPLVVRDQALLNELIEKYDIERGSVVTERLPEIFKDEYAVAFLLPFMYEQIDNPGQVMRNTLIMELYQGMLLAQKDLERIGIKLNFFTYDTKRDVRETNKILPKIAQTDVIVGPLYAEPVSVVSAFSAKNKINMVNPMSNNSDYTRNNPYAFLLKPSFETMAVKLAAHVASQGHNRNAAIVYSRDSRDSLFAFTYKKAIEAEGFNVVYFNAVDELSAKRLLDSLTKTYEHLYQKTAADSIAKLPGRFIKTRKMRDDELRLQDKLPWFIEETEANQRLLRADPPKMLAYEMKLQVPKDTIGHFMVAARTLSIINNITGAVAARVDSAGIYGYTDWFDFPMANFNLFELINAQLTIPDYYDSKKPDYKRLEATVINTYRSPITSAHVNGYECIWYLGQMLNKYGKYFQNGFSETGIFTGKIQEGIDLRGVSDNQIVPIIQLKNLKKTVVNQQSYDDF